MKFMNQSIQLFVCVLLSMILLACGQGNEQGFKEAVSLSVQNIGSIEVSGSDGSLRVKVGETQSFKAEGVVNGSGDRIDLSDKVHWSTSDSSIASIDGQGLATGLADGTVSVTASYADLSDSASLKSSSADVQSVAVTNPNASLSLCDTSSQALSATATYTDGDQDEVTELASWSSSSDSTIYVGNQSTVTSREGKGMLSALSTGSATITATYDSVPGTIAVNVTNDIDSGSISVTAPGSIYVDSSVTYSFAATASFGNDANDVRDVSSNVSWSSDASSNLSFSNAVNPATALVAGDDITVTAACDPSGVNETGSVTVDVLPERTITGVVVKYGSDYIGNSDQISANTTDTTIQLEAYIAYSDGSYSDTDLASDDDTTWSFISSNGEDSEIDSDGLVTIAGEGLNEYELRHVVGTQGYEIEFYINVK